MKYLRTPSLVLLLAIGTESTEAKTYLGKRRKEVFLSVGLSWTRMNLQTVSGQLPPNDATDYKEKAMALTVAYKRQIQDEHFVEIALRPKLIKFATVFAYENPPRVFSSYGSVVIPGFDFSATYNYRYQWKRLSIEPRAGFTFFIQGYNGDTARFIDQLGEREWTIGYYGNALKLGYTAGLDVSYRLFGRLSAGIDAQYQSPFRNNYNYFYRERYIGSSHDPDITYGLKMNNLYVGFRLVLQLGKRVRIVQDERPEL